MARTPQEIYNSIVARAVIEYAAAGVTLVPANWSKYSPRRLTFWVIAVCMYTLEVLFDEFKSDVNATLAQTKPHTHAWYAYKAKQFRYGQALIPGTDQYDDTGLDEAAIAALQIIKFASAGPAAYGVRLKIATVDGSGNLVQVGTTPYNAFKDYMNQVKDAGVFLDPYFTNNPADYLKLSLKVYYDPLVLTSDGKRLDGTNDTPVLDAINSYIKSIDFDKEFRFDKFTDTLQAIDGVVIPHIVTAQAKYGVLAYFNIDVKYQPDAGYLKIYNTSTDLTIQYIPYAI